MSDRRGMKRLEAAADAWLRFRASGSTDTEQFLREHEDLRDLLEGMLESVEEEIGEISPRTSPLVGRTLDGDFRLVREVGRGGMGIVFEALQLSLDRRVAVKVLVQSTEHPQTVARFKREANTAARLRHEGIIDVYAVGTDGDLQYFAMELVPGLPLDRFVAECRDVPIESLDGSRLRADQERADRAPRGFVRTVVELVARVADALDYAHEAGVIHRDVKPSNILLRPDGLPVLTDFGLAREDRLPSMTRTGDFAGTPYYVSPEQAAGGRDRVDRRTDVFSLGVTLYELLTLQRPFEGETTERVLHAIRAQEAPDPRRLNTDINADLVAVVMKALEKDARRRYATAAEFATDLRNVLDLLPVSARRWTRSLRVRRWMRREPLRATIGAILVLGIPTLSFLGGYVLVKQDQITVGAEQLREREFERLVTEGFVRIVELRHALAVAPFEAALAIHPEAPEVVGGLVVCDLNLDATERALQRFADHADVIAGSVGLRQLQTQVLLERGEVDASAIAEIPDPVTPVDKFLTGFIEFHRHKNELRDRDVMAKVLRYFDDAVIQSPHARAMFHLFRAQTAAKCEDHDKVVQSVDALVAMWPDADLMWKTIGICLQEADPERAVEAFHKALEVEPDDPSIHTNLGVVSVGLGDFDTARAAFDRALELDDELLGVHLRYSRLFEKQGDIDGAVAQLEREIEISANPDIVQHLAEFHLKHGRIDDAFETFEKGVEDHPEDGHLRHGYGWLLMRRGRLDAATDQLRAACRFAPEHVRAWYTLGVALQKQDDAEAIEVFAKTTEVDPKFYPAYYGMGAVLNGRRRHGEAIEPLRRAVAIEPEYALAHYALGVALAYEDRGTEAVEHLLRAMQLRDRFEAVIYKDCEEVAGPDDPNPVCRILCRAALTHDPDAERPHDALVRFCRVTSDWIGERLELRRWIDRHPDSAAAWRALAERSIAGDVPEDMRDAKTALLAARRAVELDGAAESRIALADALFASGDTAAALRTVDETTVVEHDAALRAALEERRAAYRDGQRQR